MREPVEPSRRSAPPAPPPETPGAPVPPEAAGALSPSETVPPGPVTDSSRMQELQWMLRVQQHERRELESRLQERRDIDELKACFITLACHEVRGALCVLAGFLDLAREDLEAALDPATREFLGDANRQLDRLTSLLQMLADLGPMQPPSNPEAARAPLADIVQQLVPALELQFGPQELVLHVDLDAETAGRALHVELVTLALRALVDNCSRLDPGPLQLDLCSRLRDGMLEIELARPGAELMPVLHDKVLESFAPGTEPPGSNSGGLSLALWIAWRAAAALGGQLLMHSERGKGVRFTLRLPLDRTCGGEAVVQ